MMFREDGPRHLPAQFALRVAVLGAFSLVMFSIIFFRLWYLQVLSGDDYLAEAQNNRVREFTVQAPRGQVLDRNGEVLVDNRTALALQVKPAELPKRNEPKQKVLRRVTEMADMEPDGVKREIRRQIEELPSAPVTLRRDVAPELSYYLSENEERFPGVSVEPVFVRRYPQGTLAAHLLGYVREVNAEQLEDPRFGSLAPGDFVGQAGIEDTYDGQLRGVNGATRVQVDASGSPTGGRQLSSRQAQPGNNLRLSIDAALQAAGEGAIDDFGKPGAFVAMDVDDGEVLALGSTPTYDPSLFSHEVISQSTYKRLTSDTAGAPITNRAIQGLYPTGSTFKPITALAALDAGVRTPGTVINDAGSVTIGDREWSNAGGVELGPVDLRRALQYSSDVYFYLAGQDLEYTNNALIQKWAHDLGLGSPTGIDVPEEFAGLVQTPEWRNELYEQAQSPDSPGGKEIVYPETDRPWSVGDSVNLAVGQGELQVHPLQLATAYSTIANGGNVVRPHVGLRIEDQSERTVQEIDPAPRRRVEMQEDWRKAILEGLRAAAMEPGGTSYGTFGGYPIDIAGKTGTAETPKGDQSWYVGLAPYPDPQVVVAVTIEGGGFGAEAAAPVTARILETYFNFKPGEVKSVPEPGDATTGVIAE